MFYEVGSSGYKELLKGIYMKTLVYGERTLLSEFKLTKGAKIPVHQHPYEQTGYLISGELKFIIDNEEKVAKPGCSWSIPKDVPHAAEVLADSLVIEVFSPAREDYMP